MIYSQYYVPDYSNVAMPFWRTFFRRSLGVGSESDISKAVCKFERLNRAHSVGPQKNCIV